MFKSGSILRFVASLAAGTFITLILFGLLLTLLWGMVPHESGWKLASAFLASALSMFAGGFVIAWLSKAKRWILPALFGLCFGALSFVYMLGLDWIVLGFAAGSALFAALGGVLFRWVARV